MMERAAQRLTVLPVDVTALYRRNNTVHGDIQYVGSWPVVDHLDRIRCAIKRKLDQVSENVSWIYCRGIWLSKNGA